MVYEKIPEYFNVSHYLIVECNLQQNRGNSIAIYYQDESYTYNDLEKKTNQYANYLIEQGVVPGERIGLYMHDCPEFIFLFFGSIKAGIIPVLMNAKMNSQEITKILESTGAVFVFTEDTLEKNIALPNKGNVIKDTKVIMEQLNKYSDTFKVASTKKDDAAFILFTSGSSGIPKGAVHRQYDMVAGKETFGKCVLDQQPDDVFYSHSKMSFAYGLGGLYIPISNGASLVVNGDDSLYDIFDIIEKYHVTKFQAVPSVYQSLYMLFPKDKNPFVQCKMCVSGGEPLTKKLAKGWKEKTGLEIYQSYGSTEMLTSTISNFNKNVKHGSMGKVVTGFTATILNEAYEEVKPGEIGNLYMKGESFMEKYWNNDAMTQAVLTEYGLKTGDMCYYDEDGFIWFAGRNSDVFKVNGIWQSALPIEEIITEDDNVQEVVVTSEVDNNMDSSIVAYLVAKDLSKCAESVKNIRTMFFKKRMRTLCPIKFCFVNKLPRGTTGKVKRGSVGESEVLKVIE